MIENSEATQALFKAMLAAQTKLTGVKRDSTNPHFRNRYASLEAVIDAARGPLLENGLTFTQAPGRIIDGAVEVTTMLAHADSGQWLRSTLHVPLAKTDPQGVGSAITYGCRYALMATLGLPPVDDDAEASVGRPAQQSTPAAKSAPVKVDPKAAQTYVANAKQTIRATTTERELTEWWKSEHENRHTLKLKPDEGPGQELMDAYADRKAEFQSDLRMAG